VTAQIIVTHPPGYAPERRYAAEVLLAEFLGLEVAVEEGARSDVQLTLAGEPGSVCVADGIFATPQADWLTEAALPRTPIATLDVVGTPPLPVLYGHPRLELEAGQARLGVDVFGGSFFMLTRYEELVVMTRDDHDRFPAPASLAARENLLGRPIVNEYLEVLWRALTHVWPRLERRRREYALLPSHDVDWPLTQERMLHAVARRAAGDVAVRRDPRVALARLASYGRGPDRDINNTFDAIMDASERRGLRSAFYFIAGHSAGAVDGNYSLDDPWIRGLLRRIHERGHELGLHTSYNTFRDPERTRAERAELARVCEAEGIEQPEWGGRQHFLRWENPTTWQNWANAGLAYDSTLGFDGRAGFRCGVCYDYPVFNLRTRCRLALRERPLVAMEMSVLDRPGVDAAAAAAEFEALKTQCRRHGGSFTLLWHNSRLVLGRERRLYEEVLGAA
jgi:hypothetical protein